MLKNNGDQVNKFMKLFFFLHNGSMLHCCVNVIPVVPVSSSDFASYEHSFLHYLVKDDMVLTVICAIEVVSSITCIFDTLFPCSTFYILRKL